MTSDSRAGADAHGFLFGVNEPVAVTLTGRVIKRSNSVDGNEYWVEQNLPNGRTARQWFKETNVYPSVGE